MTTRQEKTGTLITVEDPAVRALLPDYLARRAQDVASIRAWLATGEFDQIAVLAHRMRGSGTAYGVALVTEIGRIMEQAAGEADRARVREAADRLEEFLSQVKLA